MSKKRGQIIWNALRAYLYVQRAWTNNKEIRRQDMREKILAIIEKNSRIDLKDLAILLGENEAAIANEIAEMEKEHIICGYHTLINWDNTSDEKVMALIEVKVTPQRGMGFDKIAERIYQYSEVNAVYLMSGAFDFTVFIEGKTMRKSCPPWNRC